MLDDPTRKAQPEALETAVGEGDEDAASGPNFGSLADDVSALIDDGKTYLEAEIAYQKTRVGFAGEVAREGVIYVLGALAFLHLALIAVVVGLVIALGPYLTPFGAMAVVAAVLLIAMFWFGMRAMRRFKSLGEAFKDGDDG